MLFNSPVVVRGLAKIKTKPVYVNNFLASLNPYLRE